jgi:hypothetical protein
MSLLPAGSCLDGAYDEDFTFESPLYTYALVFLRMLASDLNTTPT